MLDLQLGGPRLLALELGEKLPRLVLGRDEAQCARGEHYEQQEAKTRHGEAIP
jgi:hypothetical protein